MAPFMSEKSLQNTKLVLQPWAIGLIASTTLLHLIVASIGY